MTKSVKAPATSIALFVAPMLLGISVAVGQTSTHQSDEELAEDLRTVIILAGYQCKEVAEISTPTPTDYVVSCSAGRLYRVRISDERKVVVDSQSGQPATASATDTDHERSMNRHLFAIVNLSGHDCASVLSYERHGPSDSFVTCEDQTVYRIHVTPEGRVAVDKSPIDK